MVQAGQKSAEEGKAKNQTEWVSKRTESIDESLA